MRYTLRWCNTDQHASIWDDINQWGYPENTDEFGEPLMIAIGDGAAYVWFEYITTTDLLLHMAADPQHRGRFLNKRTIQGVYWAAELLGADRLWVITDIASVNNYVKRCGWTLDTAGWYKRITP